MGLTAENVLDIKRGLKEGKKGKELAEAFGVTEATIGHIRTGHTWSSVKLPEDKVPEDDVLNGKPEVSVPVPPKKATMDIEIHPNGDITVPSKEMLPAPLTPDTQAERLHNGLDNIRGEKALSTIKLLGKKNAELEARIKELEDDRGGDKGFAKKLEYMASHMNVRLNDLDKQAANLLSLAEYKRGDEATTTAMCDAIVALAVGDNAVVNDFIREYLGRA